VAGVPDAAAQFAPPTTPAAAALAARRGFSPFPAQTRWALPLNSLLVAPPSFDGPSGYFAIEGDILAAYDLTDGTIRWIAAARPQSAAVVGDKLLFIEEPEGLSALRTEDGMLQWHLPFAEPLATPLAWDSGLLIAATAGALHAFRSTDGERLWEHAVPSHPRGALALKGNRLYVSFEDGYVRAFQAEDGAMLWQRRLGGPPNAILALDDRVFVGCNDNYFYALEGKDGVVAWRIQTGADIVERPAYDERHVYVTSLDNVLRALNRSNGVQQWKRPLPFRPAWPPIKIADAIVVAGLAGPPKAFYARDGTPAGDMVGGAPASLPVPPPRTLRIDEVEAWKPPTAADFNRLQPPPSTGFGPAATAPVTISATSELAGPVHAFVGARAFGPLVIGTIRALASGAAILAMSREVEPPMVPLSVPLPGVIPVSQKP